MATLTCTPTSPRATVDYAKIAVDAADQNDAGAYTTTAYPTMPELRYYIKFSEGGVEKGRSYVFSVDENGDHLFNNYLFPDAGTYDVTLHNAATDAQVATLSVTVQ
jgi:hypothetical protein